MAREHKPLLVKQQFSEARQKQNREEKVSDVKFIPTYNPALPNINKIIKNNLSILHTDEKKKIFPSNTMKILYRREKNLKGIHSNCTVYFRTESLSSLSPKIWAIVSCDIKNAKSLNIFKEKIKL